MRNKDVSVFTHRPTQLSIPLGKWKINPADERSQGSQTALRGLGPWGLASNVNNFLQYKYSRSHSLSPAPRSG